MAALKPPGLTIRTYADPLYAGSGYTAEVVGNKLKPGTRVAWYWKTPGEVGEWTNVSNEVVASDGTIATSQGFNCSAGSLYVTGEAANGDPVTSKVIAKGADCA